MKAQLNVITVKIQDICASLTSVILHDCDMKQTSPGKDLAVMHQYKWGWNRET